ncbi:MAG: ATPase domain, partial [Planctomycetota bacterium]
MTSDPSAGPARHGFHGREQELAWLRSQFDAVAARGDDGRFVGPRMAFIVAESGIGKSRLVQELYLRLTNDPRWDPPEVDYWPDAFGDGGVNLAVVPDMKGHVPKGPPRFAWLGARWHAPDERNALDRRSVLPEVRSSATTHAEILRRHGSVWSDMAGRLAGAVRADGLSEAIEQAADAALPFGGLLAKLAGG